MPDPQHPAVTLTATVDALLEAAVTGGSGMYTGRKIVTFKPGAYEAGVRSLAASPSLRAASSADFTDHAVDFATLGDAASLLFPELNVAVMPAAQPGEPVAAMAPAMAVPDSPILAIEPETFVFPAEGDWQSYVQGFAAAAARIAQDLGGMPGAAMRLPAPHEEEAAVAAATWGLVATRATESRFSGAGIKVAVLDTGFDLRHPDFQGRAFTAQSFIAGQAPQDGNGHGTHTTGTACGPKGPVGVPRYGTAFGAPIFVGKVLSDTGGGTTATVLAGMNWAVANRCQVISMSLGADGVAPQTAYTQAGQAALNAGCLMIAAAGNASRRPGFIAPTGAPGNSPTIMSVAALDAHLQVAFFSSGGKVDIAGPGLNVFSSWPMPKRYNTESGTSMATPHVSGAAALWAQSNPTLRGQALWNALVQHARRLPLPAGDVGAGLVQCP
jgi:subtilisin family serine protease